MLPRAVCAFLLTLLSLAAQQAPAPAARARQALDLLLAEKYSSLAELFTPDMKQKLTEEVLRTQVAPSIRQLGKVQTIDEPKVQKIGQYTAVLFPLQFPAASIIAQLTLNEAGQVAGLFFRPAETAPAAAWQRPAYSKPDSFRERDVTIGDDRWKLPGTLAVPAGKGPFPAVALVHGSGPNDRDETVLATKPFRDLAEGLASRGIAVLRYEKRTKVYGAALASAKGLTVQEETVEDAARAAALLRTLPEIDARRVFVLGHSLGGYVAPRIAKQDAKLAGVIILAGNTRPLEELVAEQTEYLSSLGGGSSETAKQQAEALLQSLPAEYLRDLHSYDAPMTARELAAPLLILQGERDYQVTMQDFAGWKKGLEQRKDVTFRSYPALNHLFVAGEGKSSPAEYQKPAHVSGDVIDDIAKWVAARK